MLSPIKTTPLPLLFFVSVGVIECVGAKGIYHKLLLTHKLTHTRTHIHTQTSQSPLQLSNVKVRTQSNKGQTRPGRASSTHLGRRPPLTESAARGDLQQRIGALELARRGSGSSLPPDQPSD